MPDWVPQVAPDLCSRCGAYWECEHNEVTQESPRDVELTTDVIRAARDRLASEPVPAFFEDAGPWAPDQSLGKRLRAALDQQFEELGIPDTFDFTKLDSLGLARAGDAP